MATATNTAATVDPLTGAQIPDPTAPLVTTPPSTTAPTATVAPTAPTLAAPTVPAKTAATKTAADYLNPRTDTVAGQMTGLLSKDSDYMRRAETKAMQYANQRGILNSSIAAGAGTAAAIESALPIAQADASTYAGFAGRGQQFEQQQAINADQFAQDRALKKYEQDNLAWSQYLKGYSDIAMQDLDPGDKAMALKGLTERYMAGNPIAGSLESVSIQNGQIVRAGGAAPSAGVGAVTGAAPATGAGVQPTADTSRALDYNSYSSVAEMPTFMREQWQAKYGDIAPAQVDMARNIKASLDRQVKGIGLNIGEQRRVNEWLLGQLQAADIDPASWQKFLATESPAKTPTPTPQSPTDYYRSQGLEV